MSKTPSLLLDGNPLAKYLYAVTRLSEKRQRVVHDLKIYPEWFVPVSTGEKKAEFRFNDRDFQVGDILRLREYEPGQKCYTGREANALVTHMFSVDPNGAYVVLSIELVSGEG